jgi:hypothetical protein
LKKVLATIEKATSPDGQARIVSNNSKLISSGGILPPGAKGIPDDLKGE